MKKFLLTALLATSVGAQASVALDTNNFEASIDDMTSSMEAYEKNNFLQSLAQYNMFKSQPQDLSLSIDEINKRTYAEFDGLTANEIMRAIELSYAVKKQNEEVFAHLN